jgi:2-dehydropantoate 2-reductase
VRANTGALRRHEKAVVLKILVFGAGVIGSLYAARLRDSGQDVSILARGDRLATVKAHGIVLEDVQSGRRTETSISVVDRLSPEDSYDLVVVCIGRHQLPSVLPSLTANRHTPSVLFMMNNAEGLEKLTGSVGQGRILGGFPGAGGVLHQGTVRYLLIRQQSTVLGEPGGRKTPRLQEMENVFRKAGFPTGTTGNIDAWLKTHAMFITCIESAIYLSDGDNQRLARSPGSLIEMVDGVGEGFRVLHALKTPVTPLKLKIMFEWMPRRYPIGYWRGELQGKLGEYSLAPHTRASSDEIRELIEEIRGLVRRTAVPTPAMTRLYSWVDSRSSPGGGAST